MSVNAERSLLGAILVDNRAYRDCVELGLRPNDFQLKSHQQIYSRIRDLADSVGVIDLTILSRELARHGELDSIGGISYVAGLIDGVPEPPTVRLYVKAVQETAERRRLKSQVSKIQGKFDDLSVPTVSIAEQLGLNSDLAPGQLLPPRLSEDDLALRFARRHGDELRYVAQLGKWMRWDAKRWVADTTLHVFDLARTVCREASAECGESQNATALRLASKASSAAVERLAASDRRHAATVEQWDSLPWLLNTPAGTIDLQTGQMRPHYAGHYLTKITAAGPDGRCEEWLRFLDRITSGDGDLKAFLQRTVGYCLTGITREHTLFFFHGNGANGKSVFLSTISRLLGDYAKTAPASTFTAAVTEHHPTDLAGLRGARLVVANETEEGARWAESKIKSLTGGDKIAARFMRGDFFEFLPEFKIIIAGNHRPMLQSVDESIRRRLNIVPFPVTIPVNERDPLLAEKLCTELPGILNWAIRGCLDWQSHGLNPPQVVLSATAEYLAGEDSLGRWLDEQCLIDGSTWTPFGDLYVSYKTWSRRNSEHEWSAKRFAERLEARGFHRQRTPTTRGFRGLKLAREGSMTHMTGQSVSNVTRGILDARKD